MKLKAIVMAVALLAASSTFGQTPKDYTDLNSLITGSDFLSICPNSDADGSKEFNINPNKVISCTSFVEGYMEALNDALNVASKGKKNALGDKTNGQIYDTVAFYITDHPAMRGQPLALLMTGAIINLMKK